MESNDITSRPVEQETSRASGRSWSVKKLILGLSLLGVVTLACLGTIAYATLGQLWQDFSSSRFSASVFSVKPVSNKIAFVGNDDNVWLVSPNGNDLNQITNDGKGYRFPTWAPDGNYLAYIGPGLMAAAAMTAPSAG